MTTVAPDEYASGAARHYDDWRQHEPITLPSPAAGTGFTHVVPGTAVQCIRTVSFVYTCSGAAANRIPRVEFLDAAGNVFAAAGSPFLLIATNVARFTFATGIQQFGANSAAQIGCALPELKLIAGLAIRVAVTAIQAGDQISGVALFVDQYPVRD